MARRKPKPVSDWETRQTLVNELTRGGFKFRGSSENYKLDTLRRRVRELRKNPTKFGKRRRLNRFANAVDWHTMEAGNYASLRRRMASELANRSVVGYVVALVGNLRSISRPDGGLGWITTSDVGDIDLILMQYPTVNDLRIYRREHYKVSGTPVAYTFRYKFV